jgi:hypothetical protein
MGIQCSRMFMTQGIVIVHYIMNSYVVKQVIVNNNPTITIISYALTKATVILTSPNKCCISDQRTHNIGTRHIVT